MKYIYYQAKYGISHTLSIIARCLVYAEKNNRQLIVDTETGCWLKEPLTKYMKITHPNFSETVPDNLLELSCYPNQYKGNLNKHIQNMPFDEDLVIEEDLIVYGSWLGSGPEYILRNMIFKQNVIDLYKARLTQLPSNYISVHIRNTDRISNVDEFIEQHKNDFNNNVIFVASDHAASIKKMKEQFNVVTFANIQNGRGHNIHLFHENIPTEEFNMDCFVDILLLAKGVRYFHSCIHSQYSRIAKILHNDPQLLKKITGE
jgi:hypothetical protein